MASKSSLAIGIRIGATDEASNVIRGLVNNANASMRGLVGGLAASGLSYKGMDIIGGTVDQFESKEAALQRVRIMTMRVGKTNEDVFSDEKKWIEKLSSTYTGSIEDYAKMTAALLRYRLTPQEVMGGIGESAAKLGVVFDVPAEKAASFFGKMKNDFDVLPSEMDKLADMLSKIHRMGVGITGEDAINEMTQAFSKEGLSVRNLGMHGAKAAEKLGLLSAIFINTGQTGQSVGTNLRRILEGAMDPNRAMKVSKRANAIGIPLNFTDSHGNFIGIDGFVAEMSKLKGLSTSALYHVLEPLSGRQGLSTSMDVFMGKFGQVEFDKYTLFLNSLIGINDEFSEIKKTLEYLHKTRTTNIENLQAAIGGSMGDDMKRFNKFLGEAATGIKQFVDEYPSLSKMTFEFSSISLSLLGIYSSLKLAGNYIPILNGLAGGLSVTIAGIAASAFLFNSFMKSGNEWAEQQKTDNPNSVKSKIIAGYDEKINDPNTGFWKRMIMRGVKAGIGFNTAIFGDHSENSKYNSDAENAAMTNARTQHKYYSNGAGFDITRPGTEMLYAPNITIGSNAIDRQGLNNLLRQNMDVLTKAIEDYQRRQSHMIYGQ